MAATADTVKVAEGLSALAWVQEDLRRSLEGAHKALRRQLKAQSGATELDPVDPAILSQARTLLHQAAGAAELVGLGTPVRVLEASEAALQRLALRGKGLTPSAVEAIEHGSFAVLEYIARQLAGKPVTPLALFPQYKALQELAGSSRIHPADLWPVAFEWRNLPADASAVARPFEPAIVTSVEYDLLALMRGAPPSVAARMSEVFAGLAAGLLAPLPPAASGSLQPPEPSQPRLATLWQLAAAFFEAQSEGRYQPDLHGKRMGSRLLAQLRAGPQAEPSVRLAHDLLFFCARAASRDGPPTGTVAGARLAAVRSAYRLQPEPLADFEVPRLGRFDPEWVVQGRRRVEQAKDQWSAICSGDLGRLHSLIDQMAKVSESLQRLYPDGELLGRALMAAAHQTAQLQAEPPAELAMEVATALLYIDASLDDADFDQPETPQRVQRLAQRIDLVRQQRNPGVLELWMEDLYRRVSDRQSMGNVVQELRGTLSDVEQHIDQYFRNPQRRELLIPVISQLQAMRGVLSVLGLDQASQAVQRMSEDVDSMSDTEADPAKAARSGSFERLADNLGSLSFLIDMVAVQPQMAKSLFKFDAATGRLSARIQREERPSGFDVYLEDDPAEAPAKASPDTDAVAVALEFDRMLQQSRQQRGAAEPVPVGSTGLPIVTRRDPLVADSLGQLELRPRDLASRPGEIASVPPTVPPSDTPAETLGEDGRWPVLPQQVAHPRAPAGEPLGLLKPLTPTAPVAPPAPPARAPVAEPAAAPDPEMLEVFLEEAAEVIARARVDLAALETRNNDRTLIVAVRRAFHTLKGSGRMVGLRDFGEAAYACEQLYNARLALEQPSTDAKLHAFSVDALAYFERWVQAIAAGRTTGFTPEGLVDSAQSASESPRAPAPRAAPPAPVAVVPLTTAALAAAQQDATPLTTAPLTWPPGAPASEPSLLLDRDEWPTVAADLSVRVPGLPSADDLDLPAAKPVPVPPAAPAAPAVPATTAVSAAPAAPPEPPALAAPPAVPATQWPQPAPGRLELPDEPDPEAYGSPAPTAPIPILPDPLSDEATAVLLQRRGAPSAPSAPPVQPPQLSIAEQREREHFDFAPTLPPSEIPEDEPAEAPFPQPTLPALFDLDASIEAKASPLPGLDLSESPLPDLPRLRPLPQAFGPPTPQAFAPSAAQAYVPPPPPPWPAVPALAPLPPAKQPRQAGAEAQPTAPAELPAQEIGPLPPPRPDWPAAGSDDSQTGGALDWPTQPMPDLPDDDALSRPAEFGSLEALEGLDLNLDGDADAPPASAIAAADRAASPAAPVSGFAPSSGLAGLPPIPGERSHFRVSGTAPLDAQPSDFGEVDLSLNETAEQAALRPADDSVVDLPLDLAAEPQALAPGAEAPAPVADEGAAQAPEPAAAPSGSPSGIGAEPSMWSSLADAPTSPQLPRPVPSRQYRQIGPLRISVALFDIFLGEAEQLSRQLQDLLAQWREAPDRPITAEAIARAHSLSGGSATVGFSSLSQLARSLERGLERQRARGHALNDEPELFGQASDEIRRLLHLFAAGFLQQPDAGLLARLEANADASAADPAAMRPTGRIRREGEEEDSEFAPLSELGGLSEFGSPPLTSRRPGLEREPAGEAPDFDDEVDQQDAIDDELFPVFVDEAGELLPTLHASLRSWAQSPRSPQFASASLRALHTFKGGARLAGAMQLGELSHRLETAIERLNGQPRPPTASDIERLMGHADALDHRFEALRLAVAGPRRAEPALSGLAPLDEAAPPVQAAVAPAGALLSMLPELAPAPVAPDPALAHPPEAAPPTEPSAAAAGVAGVDRATGPDADPAAEAEAGSAAGSTAATGPDAALQPTMASQPEHAPGGGPEAGQVDGPDVAAEVAPDVAPDVAAQEAPEVARVDAPAIPALPVAALAAVLPAALGAALPDAAANEPVVPPLATLDDDAPATAPMADPGEPLQVELARHAADGAGALPLAAAADGAARLDGGTPLATDPSAEPSSEPTTEPTTGSTADPVPADAASVAPALSEGWRRPEEIQWQRFELQPPVPAFEPMALRPSTGSVRVRAAILDRLVAHAGEVSIARSRIEADAVQFRTALGELNENLERLRAQLRDIELQAETQIASRIEAARAAQAQFDPLEMDRFTRFQELTRMMAESVGDVATVQRSLQRTLQSTEDQLAQQHRMSRDIQDDLLRTRLVEFEGMSERLYRVVRQAAKETGKSVRLDIVGGSIEIDRGVLERMTPAFEHLLRNSVVHGIEPADERQSAGKDPTGTIQLSVGQIGNEVAVEVRDDGAGLNLARIRDRAVASGLVQPDAAPDDGELANLIFQPGFTTAQEVTEMAGRGVGMDVVRTEVNAIGGRIETATTAGRGASFRLVLPLTTAVTQVVMLRCGARQWAVPSTLVESVTRRDADELSACYARGSARVGERELPFFWLDALLQGEARGEVDPQATAPIVVIRSASRRVVLHVDEVTPNQEVVVKHLGPQLSRLPGMVGVTLLPSGVPALIYNPVPLATLHGAAAHARVQALLKPQPQPLAEPAQRRSAAPLVMVVDDSLTVRRVTQRLLEREGYRVALAKDGQDALDQLDGELPVVVLSDIEMPRMDGFDLLRQLRQSARLAQLPVVMITSRLAAKHREYAAELGASHYLGKPYAEDQLLSLVAGFAGRGGG